MKTVYDLERFEENIVKELSSLMHRPLEGSLLWKYWDDKERMEKRDREIRYQTSFLINILDEIRPKRILEVGTYKAFFDYFCKCYSPNIIIDTFGNDKDSQKCVDYLNNIFGNTINFYLGDSRTTLINFNPEYDLDFAWVDGGHTENIALSDLINCDRLRIKNIAVDDVDMLSVRKAVEIFISHYKYKISGESLSERKIYYLTKII